MNMYESCRDIRRLFTPWAMAVAVTITVARAAIAKPLAAVTPPSCAPSKLVFKPDDPFSNPL